MHITAVSMVYSGLAVVSVFFYYNVATATHFESVIKRTPSIIMRTPSIIMHLSKLCPALPCRRRVGHTRGIAMGHYSIFGKVTTSE